MSKNLEEAVAETYGDASAPDQADAARAATLRSWGFTPDPAMEAQAAARKRHPDAYPPPDLAEAIYSETKAAHEAAEETR